MKIFTKIAFGVAIIAGIPSLVSAASLSVSPTSQAVKTGETFKVTIRLDTQGASIDGVDIRYLNFNPAMLQVVDANASSNGVQIAAGNLMTSTLLNNVDNASGKISLSQVVTVGSKYKGAGTLATVTFKAVGSGTASLTFNHTPQTTTDSNVATDNGKDVLTTVINGSYVISGAAGQPPRTVTPPVTQPANNNQGTALPEPGQVDIPDSDSTAFEFSERKGFWQILMSLINDAATSFKNRLGAIFGK